jgi:Na+/serine symporter
MGRGYTDLDALVASDRRHRGLVGHVRGVCLPLGYALGQMLVTIQSVFGGEFGALGWLFIGGYAAVATLVTLSLIGVTTLLKKIRRAHSTSVS